ncbi:hypothetical protein RB195_020786 [Necator americanus]|uniref:Uncharacterized protein n=1 Tax=Necator americanus TaxID=51031 RepID=A0ABR1CKG7_NECAM
MINDLIFELGNRKRAAVAAYKCIEVVVKRVKKIELRAHVFTFPFSLLLHTLQKRVNDYQFAYSVAALETSNKGTVGQHWFSDSNDDHSRERAIFAYLWMIFLYEYVETMKKFERESFFKTLVPVDKCARGRFDPRRNATQVKPVKVYKTKFEKMAPVCEAVIIFGEDTASGISTDIVLYDIVLRPVYIPKDYLFKMRPFCHVGSMGVLCVCRSDACFKKPLDLLAFLVGIYKFNQPKTPADKDVNKEQTDILKSIFNNAFDTFYDNLEQRDLFLHAIITEMRRNFGLESKMPAVPKPELAEVAIFDRWKEFDDEFDKMYPEQKPSEKDLKRKKQKSKRLICVIVIMGCLNAVSFFLIVAFFVWYKRFFYRITAVPLVEEPQEKTPDEGKKSAEKPQEGPPGGPQPAAAGNPAVGYFDPPGTSKPYAL